MTVEAVITNPDGSPVKSGDFEAFLYQNGKLYYSTKLYPAASNGTFEGFLNLGSQQGTFLMIINGTSGMQRGYSYT